MAWNPSPEVAVARDAARRLGELAKARVEQVILVYTTDRDQYGMVSYGATKELCAAAGETGDWLFDALSEYLSGADGEASALIELSELRRENAELRERLNAIADHEHCLTEHTVDGLRELAKGGLL